MGKRNQPVQFFGSPAAGRVVVRQLSANLVGEHGFTLPDAKNNTWGIVIDLGAPPPDMYADSDIRKWNSEGIHPCPFKVGDHVLLPHLTGRKFELEGETFFVFWQTDIEVFIS